MNILNDSFITQVYTWYLDLASFSRRVSAREPCGQFWDENEKLCWALTSILLGSRCPEKHSIESKPIGTIFGLGVTLVGVSRVTDFWSGGASFIFILSARARSSSLVLGRSDIVIGTDGQLLKTPWPSAHWGRYIYRISPWLRACYPSRRVTIFCPILGLSSVYIPWGMNVATFKR